MVQDGIPLPGVGGTSCASPTFSGIIALLNDARLAAGKSALGFLNPLLYQSVPTFPGAFNDVTEGTNEGCTVNGFTAAVGWDPVTYVRERKRGGGRESWCWDVVGWERGLCRVGVLW